MTENLPSMTRDTNLANSVQFSSAVLWSSKEQQGEIRKSFPAINAKN